MSGKQEPSLLCPLSPNSFRSDTADVVILVAEEAQEDDDEGDRSLDHQRLVAIEHLELFLPNRRVVMVAIGIAIGIGIEKTREKFDSDTERTENAAMQECGSSARISRPQGF